MAKFLQNTAEYILEKHPEGLDDICIVLSTRRSGLFLKREFASLLKKPAFAPTVLSIADFTEMLGGIEVLPELDMLFDFFGICKERASGKGESFEEFLNWAPLMLNDFMEIDKYMVPAEEIFSYINEAYAYRVWNPDGSEPTASQRKYLDFWQSFGDYYKALLAHCTTNGVGHEGLSCRMAAENVMKGDSRTGELLNRWQRIYFVGLNALNRAEEHIIKTLLKRGVGETLWDADRYYMQDEAQESGVFLRKYHKEFPCDFRWIGDALDKPGKKITSIGVPGNIAQVKAAGQIVAAWAENGDMDDTALVLADESLLLPLLQSLPPSLREFNVTMGVPLKYFSLHNLVSLIFEMHVNAGRSAGKHFYCKDVMPIIGHPLIRAMNTEEASALIESGMMKKNMTSIAHKDIMDMIGQCGNDAQTLASIFTFCGDDSVKLLQLLEGLMCSIADDNAGDKSNPVERLCIERYLQIVKKLGDLIREKKHKINVSALRVLFEHLSSEAMAHFTGEPLQGLQVMGMLETRSLDFGRVVLLSASDDQLPGNRPLNSLIPSDVRKAFDMPTHRQREAVYAYHFYRLLQGASEAVLIYNNNSESDGMSTGEKSRFITQLGFEMKQAEVVDKTLSVPLQFEHEKPLSIQKSPAVMKSIVKKLEAGLSPSSLNRYLTCPLDFYFRDVMGVTEGDAIEEVIEASTMGSAIHAALDTLYQPCIGMRITAKMLDNMSAQISDRLESEFRKAYNERDIRGGRNLLTKKVAEKLLQMFFKKEKAFLDSKGAAPEIIALEAPLESHLDVDGVKVKIKGKADRIDRVPEGVRIVDYKSGNVNEKKLNIDKEWQEIAHPDYGQAFQLLLYAWLYFRCNPDYQGCVIPAIAPLKKSKIAYFNLTFNGHPGIEYSSVPQIEDLIRSIIGAILNSSDPFQHSENGKYCYFC